MDDPAVLAAVSHLSRQGARGLLVRAVELRGFGSRRLGETAVVSPDGVVAGHLLGGAADGAVVAAAGPMLAGPAACGLLEVDVGDAPAVEAGLACGGMARLLVQDLALVPPAWWEAVARRKPAALVTLLGNGTGRVVTIGTSDGADPVDERVLALLARAAPAVEVLPDAVIEVWWPTPRVLVVGAADLAGAIVHQAALLGWDATVTDGAGPALAATQALGPADAVVVLTHDPDVAIPVLAAGLAGGAYVGALGSRGTQRDRRERLAAAGVDDATIDRVHGPVGLNLGARTPEETALAICAEIVAVRRGRDAGSLRDSSGPING